MRKALFVALLLIVISLPQIYSPAGAGTVPPHTPQTSLQVWSVNIAQLRNQWGGFILRMQAHAFAPDIVIVNELRQTDENGDGQSDITQFMNQLTATFGAHYNHAHGDSAIPAGGSVGGNVVIWNNERLTRFNSTRWPNPCLNNKTQLAVDLRDDLAGKHVLVAAVHTDFGAGPACVQQSLATADSRLESLRPSRPMTLIGGDFNQRPDKDGELATNGLETDPDCWYRTLSAAHGDSELLGVPCGSGPNRYYDTAWLWPGSGGGANPAATSFCQQYTSFTDTQLIGPTLSDATNSCTDLVGSPNSTVPGPDGKLDKQRIDFLWVGFENASGNAWTPPAQVVQPLIADAGADLGLDLTSVSSYSDHRAVKAIVTWPVVTP